MSGNFAHLGTPFKDPIGIAVFDFEDSIQVSIFVIADSYRPSALFVISALISSRIDSFKPSILASRMSPAILALKGSSFANGDVKDTLITGKYVEIWTDDLSAESLTASSVLPHEKAKTQIASIKLTAQNDFLITIPP